MALIYDEKKELFIIPEKDVEAGNVTAKVPFYTPKGTIYDYLDKGNLKIAKANAMKATYTWNYEELKSDIIDALRELKDTTQSKTILDKCEFLIDRLEGKT